ncbi:MAG: hypothetical protein WDA12_04035 [Bacilli bacterium]
MKKSVFVVVMLLVVILPLNVEAQRGCCSHHGGVSGCSSSGRQVCNDGTLSPSCTCTPSYIYGCTDSSAKNYNSNANKANGSCTYYVMGCTDNDSINYNSNAEKDNGSCIKKVLGCMDETALNYNSSANVSDDNCKYKEEVKTVVSTKEENAVIKQKENESDSRNVGTGLFSLGIIGAAFYFVKQGKNK